MGVNGYLDSSGGVLELSWNNDRFSFRTAKNASEWNPWGEIASEQWVANNVVDLTSDQLINGKKTFTDLVVGIDSEESDL